jgi:hypothetical protein
MLAVLVPLEVLAAPALLKVLSAPAPLEVLASPALLKVLLKVLAPRRRSRRSRQ